MRLTDLELLATLENLRLCKWNTPESPDYIIRVCSAIVAENAGYKSRIEWTEAAANAGLVDYAPLSAIETAEQAKANYKKLNDKMTAKEA